MADQLASTRQLAEVVGEHIADGVAVTLLRAATAAVQDAAGQRLVAVTDDEVTLLGGHGQWLDLPQRPVTAVSAVTLDGTELTEGTGSGSWRRIAGRLWRDLGWQPCRTVPSLVTVTYSHGWPAGAQELELARAAALSIAKRAYARQVSGEGGDEVTVRAAMAAELVASGPLRDALRRRYGRITGSVQLS